MCRYERRGMKERERERSVKIKKGEEGSDDGRRGAPEKKMEKKYFDL